MSREVIQTEHAPAAVGPYSQAIKTGELLFISGQLGLIPETGKLAESLEAQTKQILANLESILSASGCGMGDIVKTTIFLTDMADFSVVNSIYAQAFTDVPPARSTVQVAALPLDGLLEIEAIALIT